MTGTAPQIVETASEAETGALGAQLGATLAPGSLVLLYGDLGAGKTAFVRGLAEGLGVDPDDVSSPTFTLVQRHTGRCPLWHVDLYRLAEGREVAELALDDLLADGGVVAVEWADRFGGTPPDGITVRITDLGDDRRRVEIRPPDGCGYSTR